MKIAYIYDAVYPWVKGGAEKRIYEIGRRLADKHEVYWYDINETVNHDGIILHGVNATLRQWKEYKGCFAGKLLPKLIKEEFDVTDCQEFPILVLKFII